jgi:predicted transcriptional regulator
MATDTERLTIRLSPAAKEAVDEIQKLGGFKTPQEAIRRAIADERFLQRWQRDGWEVLLRKGRSYRELVWPSI